ncbi:hypothetical protein GGU10DRAFT_279718, partial [Lentinula aff. detonsa]
MVGKRFVVHGPREQRKEGGSTQTNPAETPNEIEPSSGQPEPTENAANPAIEVPEVSTNTSLLTALAASQSKLDLESLLKNQYGNDTMFKKIIEKPKEYRNFEVSNGLVYLIQHDRKVLCIPRLTVNKRNIRECIINEAHSLLAHLGPKKTSDYLRDYVWWK